MEKEPNEERKRKNLFLRARIMKRSIFNIKKKQQKITIFLPKLSVTEKCKNVS